MNYYAALDVSLRSVHLCVMDETGGIQAEGQVDSAVRETIETDPALCHALLPLLDTRLVLYHTFRELDNPGHISRAGDPNVRSAWPTASHRLRREA